MKTYNPADIWSIFDYSKALIGHTLRELVSEEELMASNLRGQGKGGLEHMLEALYFKYPINSDPGPDFREAGLELKGTGLKILQSTGEYAIKERLVCDMVDYCSIISQSFEESPFYLKCKLMLLIFYLYEKEKHKIDLKFIYSVLWQIPEKDLLMMKNDFAVIIEKIKQGKAHELSEGDTEYLAVCRKGQKGDKPRRQPCSPIPAPARAFSLKPSYMRTVLEYVKSSEIPYVSNIERIENKTNITSGFGQLVTAEQLQTDSFEDIILQRFTPYIGKNVEYIMNSFDSDSNLEAKDINYRAACLIASDGKCNGRGANKIEHTDEFRKAGITLKTIPTYASGVIKESMPFKNINYDEVYSNDNWFDSEVYELFTSRFLMVQFRHPSIRSGSFGKQNKEMILEKVFFWTMPLPDLEDAREYWENIRENVITDNIRLDAFWNLKMHRKFHVRPKGTKTSYKNSAYNPNGGSADKYCYWLNANYVKSIVDAN